MICCTKKAKASLEVVMSCGLELVTLKQKVISYTKAITKLLISMSGTVRAQERKVKPHTVVHGIMLNGIITSTVLRITRNWNPYASLLDFIIGKVNLTCHFATLFLNNKYNFSIDFDLKSMRKMKKYIIKFL